MKRSIPCLYRPVSSTNPSKLSQLQLAKGTPDQDRTMASELYLANTVGMLLPCLFVIWIVIEL